MEKKRFNLLIAFSALAVIFSCADEQKILVHYKAGFSDSIDFTPLRRSVRCDLLIERRFPLRTFGSNASFVFDTILFSRQKDKLFAFVTISDSVKGEKLFFGRSYIGYLNESEWKIYEYGFLYPVLMDDPIRVSKSFRDFYFTSEFTEYGIWVKDKGTVVEKMGCTLLEEEFWNTAIFRKGALVSGKYPFEVEVDGKGGYIIKEPIPTDCSRLVAE
jgi:hypothetical protein